MGDQIFYDRPLAAHAWCGVKHAKTPLDDLVRAGYNQSVMLGHGCYKTIG